MNDIDDITIGDAKRLVALFGPGFPTLPEDHPYPVGENIIIRTVTYHYTGRLVRVTPGELVLIDVSWIALSQRWSTTLAEGVLNEVEPYPDGEVVIIPRSCVIDVTRWRHALPRTPQ